MKTARGIAFGAIAALAFPFAIPGHGPLLEWLPRELLVLVGAIALYRGRTPFVSGVGYFAVGLFWLLVPMIHYGDMTPWLAVPALLLLVVYCALYWALIPRLTRLAEGVAHPYLAFAAAVLAVDWLRSWFIGAFPWLQWSWAMTRDLPLVQLASVTGAHGITALVALTAAAIADVRSRPRASVIIALIVIVVHIDGALQLAAVDHDAAQLEIGMVQGNIAQDVKNRDLDNAKEIFTTHARLTEDAIARGAQVVVWPEASWPGRPRADITQFPYHAAVPTIIGAATLDIDAGRVTNSAFAVDPQGNVEGRYDKIALVPFGEYVPFARILRLGSLVPELGTVEPGVDALPIGRGRFGVLICYDGIFPSISRMHAANGARALLNLTNDAWYDDSSGPYQHRDVYVLRAVETDRWIARATNTGFSTIVDPKGRTRLTTKLGEQLAVVSTIGLRDGKTLYVRTGDVVVWLSLGLVATSVLVRWRRARWLAAN